MPTPRRRIAPVLRDDHSSTTLFAGPLRPTDFLPVDAPPRSLDPRSSQLYNPLIRLLLLFVAFLVIFLPITFAVAALTGAAHFRRTDDLAIVTVVAGFLVTYLVHALVVERRRPPVELAPRRFLGVLAGLLFGLVLFSAVVGVMALAGVFHLDGLNPGYAWVTPVLEVGLMAGVTEEIMFRGIFFRYAEEWLGTWAAVGLSGLVFGLAHVSNPNSSWWAGIAIAIEAGLLFALVYAVTRSLWVVIGLHAGWNLTQGPLWGIPVSGVTDEGFLASHTTGPDWLSGGGFGAEASVLSVGVCVCVSILFAVMAVRRGQIVAPMWSRRRRMRRALAEGGGVPL